MLLWQLPLGILRQEFFDEQGNVKKVNLMNLSLYFIGLTHRPYSGQPWGLDVESYFP